MLFEKEISERLLKPWYTGKNIRNLDLSYQFHEEHVFRDVPNRVKTEATKEHLIEGIYRNSML